MELLAEQTLGPYLLERGLVQRGDRLDVRPLDLGVSNVVLAVDTAELRAVVKQALPRLRVREEWLAKRERTLTEAAALELAGRLTPGAVPPVLDVDPARCAMVIEQAPASWENWKTLLLGGEADPALAARLGELLSSWHRQTEDDPAIARRFGDVEAFEQLRVDPYHRAVMRRWPRLERPIGAYVEEMLATRRCLVHGDFSPKNVLVGVDGLWVLDFEVAHVGDPVFDLAFMLSHLLLKAVHRPESLAGYRDCAAALLAGYGREVEAEYLLGHVGCLAVARVDGKSPAEYLTEGERLLARAVGTRLVLDPPGSLEQGWELVAGAVR